MKHQISQSGVFANFVWLSSFESRAAGKVSALATLETVLAVAVFWGIYLWTGFAWHLLTSVLAAPFVLFRSDAGVRMIHPLWDNWTDKAPAIQRDWVAGIVIIAYAGLAFGGGWALGTWLGAPGDGWDMLSNYALAGFAAVAVAIVVEIAVLRGRLFAWLESTGVGVLLLGSPVVGVAGMAVATGWAGPGSWIALLLLITTVPAALVGFATGVGGGALLSALALRFVTSVWHLRAGLRALPANLRRVLFLVDSA
ncbi:MAG: hypothetical protein AB8B85_10615, partial [Paracoccaceae bacterium]